MELRVLKYFLTVVQEGSITKAAKALNMTQPTLSRQLQALEEELGSHLFTRNKKKIELTPQGIILKRRAGEMLNLESIVLTEIRDQNEQVEGTIRIGGGDLYASERLTLLCKGFRELYPKVNFEFYTNITDVVCEKLNNGLLDFGMLMEPVDVTPYQYVRFKEKERWVVLMHPDDPLAGKAAIVKEDLLDKEIIFPARINSKSELSSWFGSAMDKIKVDYISNLNTIAAVMVMNRMAYAIVIEGSLRNWDKSKMVSRRLWPKLEATTILAWRKNVACSEAVQKFSDYLQDHI